mmetsp:Transcript_2965/g.4576  ORF Transcript_2965/g.4576 Transcript_2965/m.4576 type:complete len:101 (-) Transcript_2965:455-757(-)
MVVPTADWWVALLVGKTVVVKDGQLAAMLAPQMVGSKVAKWVGRLAEQKAGMLVVSMAEMTVAKRAAQLVALKVVSLADYWDPLMVDWKVEMTAGKKDNQ